MQPRRAQAPVRSSALTQLRLPCPPSDSTVPPMLSDSPKRSSSAVLCTSFQLVWWSTESRRATSAPGLASLPRSPQPSKPSLSVCCRRSRAVTPPEAVNLSMPKTIHHVIVHQAHSLHERVTDGRAHESESAPRQILAHGVGLGRARRDLLQASPGVRFRLAADKLPDVRIEAAEFPLHGQECLCVCNCGRDLQPVADNAGIGQQSFNSPLVVTCHPGGLELVKGGPETLP